MASLKIILVVALTCSLFFSTTAVRPFLEGKHHTLASRLQVVGNEGVIQCWDSLFELRACTGEVILFFLNGEAYLGPSCCRAIRVIEHHCWPTMLGALGFTAEEGNILKGYCDASNHVVPPSPDAIMNPSPAPDAAQGGSIF